MPIVSPIPLNPLADGRQSDRAMLVRRGVQRLLIEMGAVAIPELPLATGRRADLVALTRKGLIRPYADGSYAVTPDGMAYDTGMREAILHGSDH